MVCELMAAGVMASIGQLLFHLQHTFEGSYKSRQNFCEYPLITRNCLTSPSARFIFGGVVDGFADCRRLPVHERHAWLFVHPSA